MSKLIKWFKALNRIVKSYDEQIDVLNKQATETLRVADYSNGIANQAREFVKQATTLDADVHVRGSNTIIVTGRFRGNDYIQTFDLGDKDFEYTIRMFRDMARSHQVRKIDCPPGMKEIFTREEW
tara:strand:- start:862 stop:1236 length:375 start_codon:yes stop_codon:yes gene_type:complete